MKNIIGKIMLKVLHISVLVIVAVVLIHQNSLAFSPQEAPIIQTVKDHDDYLVKRKAIYQVLKTYNSPLTEHVDEFLHAAQQYDIDPYLLPSISGIESYFGQQLLSDTYNPFGWGIYGNMVTSFTSWGDGFHEVAKGLKYDYINRGADTVEKISSIYCPPNSVNWSRSVRNFMNKFEAAETQIISPVRL